jgi:hypothetical protein
MESYFLQFSKNIHSQCGEDGIIEKIFEILSIKDGIVVEFGAMDGVELSNTYNLWKNKKFKSILIEKFEDHRDTLEKLESEMDNVNCHICEISPNKEDENSLDNILHRSKFEVNNDNLSLMSIDVDSCDYQIFESLSDFKPKLIVIETNTNYNYNEDYISENNGCSLSSVNKLANEKGYSLVCHTGNAFFVRNDLFNSLPKKDYSIEKLYCNNECVSEQQKIKKVSE